MRKSIFGNFFWILWIGTLLGAIWQTIDVIFNVIPQEQWVTEGIILLCVFAGVIFVLFIIRNMSFRFRLQEQNSSFGKKTMVLEIMGLLVLFFTMAGMRIFYLSGIGVSSLETIYYQLATVGNELEDLSLQPFRSRIYISLLSVVFSLLGNKIIVAVYVQCLLQCISIVFLYGMVRNLNGKIDAFLVGLLLAVSQPVFSTLTEISPMHLVFLLFAFAMWFLSISWKYVNRSDSNLLGRILLLILSALVVTAVICVECMGFWLILMELLGLCLYEYRDGKASATRILGNVFLFLFATIVTGVLIIFVCATMEHQDVISYGLSIYMDWIGTFQLHIPYIFPVNMLEVSIGMLCIAGSWVFGYWIAKRDENIIYVSLLLAVILGMLYLPNADSYALLFQSAWILIMCVSVVSLCRKYEPKEVAVIQENAADESTIKEKTSQREDTPAVNMKNVETPCEEPPRFVPIPNPLPLPKQHVHKEMDYGVDVTDAQLHYDLDDVAAGDDYDLK
ncbi:MAG: hypothetical protein PHE02_09865 [Lachnospiraceae bacterium]|nr:hypothetical protein [Lachnospiraceae bacterium]